METIDIVKTIFDYVWIPLAGAFAWIYQRINGDIKAARAVADAAVPRAEFSGYTERAERNRQEFRETTIKLFEEMKDHMKDDIRAQERLMDALNDQTRTLTDRIDNKMDKKQ